MYRGKSDDEADVEGGRVSTGFNWFGRGVKSGKWEINGIKMSKQKRGVGVGLVI